MNKGLKLSVLYGHPAKPGAFEAYYLGTHMPLVAATPGLGRTELSRGLPGPDGAQAPYHRLFEAWFDSPAHLAQVSSTPQWQQVVADVPNFASGGVTVLLTEIG